MIVIVLFIIGGLILLYFGAELLVRGGSSLALRFGVPPLVVGLTVVAYETSAPECVVSIKSALQNQGDLAIGNVIGSNIFNILFILGCAGMIKPLAGAGISMVDVYFHDRYRGSFVAADVV